MTYLNPIKLAMKRIALLLAVIFFCLSCKKSGSDSSTVQYTFTSDVAASYTVEYSSDVNNVQRETFQGTSWSKTVTLKPDPGFNNIKTARLVAYPPSTWANTTNKAHVNLKISVDGSVKSNTDTTMTASHVGSGILQIYTY